jgi:hypothetical protein
MTNEEKILNWCDNFDESSFANPDDEFKATSIIRRFIECLRVIGVNASSNISNDINKASIDDAMEYCVKVINE